MALWDQTWTWWGWENIGGGGYKKCCGEYFWICFPGPDFGLWLGGEGNLFIVRWSAFRPLSVRLAGFSSSHFSFALLWLTPESSPSGKGGESSEEGLRISAVLRDIPGAWPAVMLGVLWNEGTHSSQVCILIWHEDVEKCKWASHFHWSPSHLSHLLSFLQWFLQKASVIPHPTPPPNTAVFLNERYVISSILSGSCLGGSLGYS